MNKLEHLYSGVQGFALGGIIMAYIADYNRSQLPIALLFLGISFICRIAYKK